MTIDAVQKLIDEKKEELNKGRAILSKVMDNIMKSDKIAEEEKKSLSEEYKAYINSGYNEPNSIVFHGGLSIIFDLYEDIIKEIIGDPSLTPNKLIDISRIPYIMEYDGIEKYYQLEYLDSEWKEYKGDIIITDPCYILKREDDYDISKCPSLIQRGTIYGDWGCTVFQDDILDKEHTLGEFCADGGEVCVVLAEEVEKYNPEKLKNLGNWCYTRIPNFDGKVRFEVEEESGVYENTNNWHTKGETWKQYNVHVVGRGNINFKSYQTGL